jgi:hypothetical protein
MDFDPGAFIGLIAVGSGAIVLGLSYFAVYMLGKDHGRRQQSLSSGEHGQGDAAHRIDSIEASVRGLSYSVERIMDAQRLLVAQQDHLSRKVGGVDRSLGFGAAPGKTSTPA